MKVAVVLSIAAVAASALASCAVQNEVQVEIVNAKLVRIDTVMRNATPVQMLIWEGSDNIHYVSYANLEDAFRIGYNIPVMVRR